MSRGRTAEMVAPCEAGDNRRGKRAHQDTRLWEGMRRNDGSCRMGARARCWGRSRRYIFTGEV